MQIFKEKRRKEYILPVKVVEVEGKVYKPENLLKGDFMEQNMFDFPDFCEFNGKGHIILDFGREYFGGVRLFFHSNGYSSLKPYLRIRFGESLGECCSEIGEKNSTNDHSTRDMVCYMPMNSDMEWGATGYRFVRLDFLEEGVFRLNRVYGTYVHSESDPIGSFECDNPLVNDIFNTAAHTLHLNMQNCIWDGIKRDQHIWCGDLYPEILGILYLYGNCREIENTFDYTIKYQSKERWINNIPLYNMWFLLCMKEYFSKTGKVKREYLESAKETLCVLKKCVNEDGSLTFEKGGLFSDNPYYFDWPSHGTTDSLFACYATTLYTMRQIIHCTYFGEENIKLAKEIEAALSKKSKENSLFKAISAMGVLVDKSDCKKAFDLIRNNGASGYSMFMTYFISKALTENGYVQEAFDNNLQYYGGMLQMGATSFWEGFEVEWMENACKITEKPQNGQREVHGDFGKPCYVGYRNSLCHGWSCGVLAFLIETVVGFRICDNDCTKFTLKPNMCGLKHISCKIPTAKGVVAIELTQKADGVETNLNIPKGLTQIK